MAVDSYSTPLLVSSILMVIVATTSIAMRLYVRIGILSGLGWDDALITASWVFAMALYGFGQHMDVVPVADIPTFSRLIMVCSAAFSWGVPAAKASFAVLYLRILQGRRHALLNKFLVVFLLCQAVEETLVVILQCRPVAKAWDSRVAGHCYRLHLQLPVAKRVGVIAMLSLGLLVCVISVIRIVFATKIGNDSTYELAQPMIWSQVEITALILCSCIPSFRQIVQKIPWLNRLVGLSSAKDLAQGNPYYARGATGATGAHGRKKHDSSNTNTHGMSIALHSRGQHDDPFDPVRSHAQSHHLHGHHDLGMVSRAKRDQDAAARPPSQDGSTDEIFPSYYHRNQGLATTGAILVTRELNIKHDGGDLGRGHNARHSHGFTGLDLSNSTAHNTAETSTSLASSSSTSLTEAAIQSPKRAN
ncbi:hypothetical protein SCUCBS95973_008668 [Sporothrix curviconia]|uniref:Rhodopsin domain-containing protein n=1 Tax=Sporothrix curviconia TaxID=1260050 RepID=A0ABP0CPZ4_9PEZI